MKRFLECRCFPVPENGGAMHVKSHTFRGRRWRVLWETIRGNAVGYAEKPIHTLIIDPRYCERELLETIVHESLHACLWDLDEEAITATASDISRLLWRLGYRLEEDRD